MKKNFKLKILSGLLAGSLCIGSFPAAFALENDGTKTPNQNTGNSANNTVLSAFVPTELPIKMNTSGDITVPTNAAIVNGMENRNIRVSNVKVTMGEGWKGVPYSDDVYSQANDTQVMALQFRGDAMQEDGSFSLTPEKWQIGANQSLPLEMQAKIPKQTKTGDKGKIATVEYTLELANDDAQGRIYILTVLDGEHGTINDKSPIKTDENGVIQSFPNVMPDEGYELNKWVNAQTGEEIRTGDMLTENISIRPVFKEKDIPVINHTHTLTILDGEHGTINDKTPLKTDKSGVIQSFPNVTPDAGYELEKWINAETKEELHVGDALASDVSICPVFKQKKQQAETELSVNWDNGLMLPGSKNIAVFEWSTTDEHNTLQSVVSDNPDIQITPITDESAVEPLAINRMATDKQNVSAQTTDPNYTGERAYVVTAKKRGVAHVTGQLITGETASFIVNVFDLPEGMDGTAASPVQGSVTANPNIEAGSSITADDLNITIPVIQPDGTTENVPVKLAPDSLPDTPLIEGDNEITVTTDINGVTIHIVVYIVIESKSPVSSSPTSMIVSKAPDKTNYHTGENFDQTGMEITVTYDDGNTKTLTGGYIVTDGANLPNGKNSVNITYTENGKTVSASQSIMTTPDLSKTPISIAVTPNSYKNTYTEGENFDPTGMEITVTYGDGHTETKTTGFEILGGNALTANKQNVTVSYSENGENITVDISLNITAKTPNPSDGLTMSLEEAEDLGFTFSSYKDGLQVSGFTNKKFKSKIAVPEQVGDFKVMGLGESCFKDQSNIQELTLPGTIQNIGKNALAGCSGITELILPESIQTVQEDALASCSSLKKIINFPGESSLRAVFGGTVDSTVVNMDWNYNILNGCNVEQVSIKEGSTKISGKYSFAGMAKLTKVFIPDSVTSIGDNAFRNCGLAEIVIPNSVTDIGSYAFNGCSNLIKVTVRDGVTDANVRGKICNYAFEGCKSLAEVTIPNGVISIELCAFKDCTGLTKIVIPDNVTKIADGVFMGCLALPEITIPNSVTTIGSDVYVWGTFENCASLKEIIIPNGVQCINKYTFDGCTGLTNVIIPDSVKSIRMYAFAYCQSLNEITIPHSVSRIDDAAFYGCKTLHTVRIASNAKGPEDNKYRPYPFAGCGSLSKVEFLDGATEIGRHIFADCESLVEVIIPNSITNIGIGAFLNCTNLANVTIPDSVTSIYYDAFARCTNLTDVIIPDDITSIGSSAFYNVPHITYHGSASGSPWGAKSIN